MHKHTHFNTRVCPWWLAPTFDNPLRRLYQNPTVVLHGLVQPDDAALDIGCGMGYFSIPLAHMVGTAGQVIAADLQPEMLDRVRRRAQKAGVVERIRLHQTQPGCIGLDESLHERVDFALAFWMVHEVRDKVAFLSELAGLLKPGGRFLFVEPLAHVNAAAFQKTVEIARSAGFQPGASRKVSLSRAIIFER